MCLVGVPGGDVGFPYIWRNILIRTNETMAFEGPVFLANKIGKIMIKLYTIDGIKFNISFQFGVNWTRIGGVISVPVYYSSDSFMYNYEFNAKICF